MESTRQLTRPDAPGADVDDLIDLLKLEPDDEYLNTKYLEGLLLSATEYASLFLNRAIITTKFMRVVEQDNPVPGIIPERRIDKPVQLPYPPIQTVDSVYALTSDCEEIILPYFLDTGTEPAGVYIRGANFAHKRVEYTAGYGADYKSVPRIIQQAITQIAAYMFNHRGDCDASSVVASSGAAALLEPFRVMCV